MKELVMQEYFYSLADELTGCCTGAEVLLLNVTGEDSDFVRLNRSLVRQAGAVTQRYLSLELIDGDRHATESFTLTGQKETDLARAKRVLVNLREQLPLTLPDPYLLYATAVNHTEQIGENKLHSTEDFLKTVLEEGKEKDVVGIFAQGGVYAGFANSLGQRNWFGSHSFHFEWCLFAKNAQDDKAVKTSYAGFKWSDDDFARKVNDATQQLAILARPARTIDPGAYRVYLAPTALAEFVGLLGWGGFGLKSHRTKTTPLLKMIEADASMHDSVSVTENTREGLAPNFTTAGFVKPDAVELIRAGRYANCLVSPRSGREYQQPVNTDIEMPRSLDLAAGELTDEEILSTLGEGVYANQLWYLNYSDMPAGRITGMTRFATFWVEGGQIVAPLNVMRFDETVFHALGENLVALTKRRDFLPSSETYDQRSVSSSRSPGAVIRDFRFTL
jgi:predicted Zn-dependent protease